MKKVFTSTLLTIAAVPFLMAAPAAKKAQNQPAAAAKQTQTDSKTAKKASKSHAKKSKTAPATNTAAPSKQ
ncbi:MAG: hypothetical protein JOY54_19495 [Acidobacteriaceae bacterium]|nr:hypothetical protein [Acidobacteriaceae bacterium]